MNIKKMLRLCRIAHDKLDDLEGVLVYLQQDTDAHEFVYESIPAVIELQHIARLETKHTVTVEQAAHIRSIIITADRYIGQVPGSAKRELGGDP
jgi:hypothetical protein